jgi:hypothetical protein
MDWDQKQSSASLDDIANSERLRRDYGESLNHSR